MITSLKIDLDIKKDPIGFVVGDHDKVTLSQNIPLYIPRLMSNIPSGEKKITSITEISNTSDIFVNDIKCRPKTKKKINHRNYINAKNLNSSISSLSSAQKVYCKLYNDSPTNIHFRLD